MVRKLVLIVAAAAAMLCADAQARTQKTAPPKAKFDLTRPEIREFIDGVATRSDVYNKAAVRALLAKAEPQPKIIELMTRPAEKVSPWWEYRSRFLTRERIDKGVQFYLEHRKVLEPIAQAHGVPPEYIVAIIGVETFYGRITGRFRVIDALATLAFDYPPRSAFFRDELEQFLLLAKEQRAIEALKTQGSYAGAMGLPQFMPSSYRKWAVDGGTDGDIDLWNHRDDMFASVANYFRDHGWQTGGPVLTEARLDPDPTFSIVPRNLELNETIESLSAQGVQLAPTWPRTTPVLLISAEQKEGPAYRVGFHNFRVITRYNRSVRYAMAVHDLSQAILAGVQSAPRGEP